MKENHTNNETNLSALFSTGLPADFFDNGPNSSSVKKEEPPEEDEPMEEDPFNPTQFYKEQKPSKSQSFKPNTAENLPEGFFDDPVQDAKVCYFFNPVLMKLLGF